MNQKLYRVTHFPFIKQTEIKHKFLCACCSFILLSSTLQHAANGAGTSLELSVSKQVSYGDSVQLNLKVINPEDSTSIPSLGPVRGLRIKGPYSRGTEQNIVKRGGRTRVTYSKRYAFNVTPEAGRTGTFTIGPATLARKGKPPLKSNTVELAVYNRPELGLRFSCEVSTTQCRIGAPFKVVYKLCYPEEASNDNPQIGRLPLLTLPGVKVKPVKAFPDKPASRTRFQDTTLFVQKSFVTHPGGTAEAALCFAFEVIPLKTGEIRIPSTKASMELKTGRYRIERDFFWGQRKVPEARTFQAETEEVVCRVKPLPAEGRPPGFTGAVGRYTIDVKTKHTKVNTYDPITLEVHVKGRGLLEELVPPAWHKLKWLTKDFDVAKDVDSGTVKEKEKVFRQTIRPTSDEVTEIPALPFPYYDPWRVRYVVAESDPIPIEVKHADTVTSKDAYRKVQKTQSLEKEKAREPPGITIESGVAANFTEMGESTVPVDPPRYLSGWPFILACSLPPLLFLFVLFGLLQTRRSPEIRARRNAFAKSRKAISKAGSDPEAIALAYQDYFRDRFQLPPGELTPLQVKGTVRNTRADEELAEKASRHLEELLETRFGAAGNRREELSSKTLRVIKEVERCSGA